jgi:hypothetical protein
MTQVVEPLPRKYEALSLIPNSAKKIRNVLMFPNMWKSWSSPLPHPHNFYFSFHYTVFRKQPGQPLSFSISQGMLVV